MSQLKPQPHRSRGHVDAFPSQAHDPSSSVIISFFQTSPHVPQTFSENIIQRHSLDLAKYQYVRAGDFVTLRTIQSSSSVPSPSQEKSEARVVVNPTICGSSMALLYRSIVN